MEENKGQTEPLIIENLNANNKDYAAVEEEKTPLLSMTAFSLNSSIEVHHLKHQILSPIKSSTMAQPQEDNESINEI